jgi:glutathione synthase/RimK-type ligase-like ATP-grasp enzyme
MKDFLRTPPELAPPRSAVRLLEEAGAALCVRVETFCGGWVVRLIHPDGRTRLVWGYHFDLNPSAGAHIARDKAATWEVLRAAGVPAVEHRLFLRADMEEYVADAGNWRSMLAALEDFRGDAVIKPADGSGGAGVSRVRSPRELEKAAGALWQREHAICLSPFLPVRREVRHILLDGEARIVYEKKIDAVIGDGRSTLGELILASGRDDPRRSGRQLAAAVRVHGELALEQVPMAGQRLAIAWKHNLRNASAILLDAPEPAMVAVASQAAAALGLRLCAVDVVELEGAAGVGPLVLEVNAGLMVERFVEQIEGGWDRALVLTRDVITRMFARNAW